MQKILLVSTKIYSNCLYSDKLNFFQSLIDNEILFQYISFFWQTSDEQVIDKISELISQQGYTHVYFLNDSYDIITSQTTQDIIQRGYEKNIFDGISIGVQYYNDKYKFPLKNKNIQYYKGYGKNFSQAIEKNSSQKEVVDLEKPIAINTKMILDSYVIDFKSYKYFVIESYPFCIHNCSFCNKSDKKDIEYNYLDLGTVRNYLEIAKNNHFIYLWFLDPSFNENKNIFDLIAIIEKYNFKYIFEIRPETIKPEIVTLFQNLDIESFNVGLQSINNNVGKNIFRPFNKKAYEKAILMLQKFGKVYIDIIIGLPGESLEGFLKTFTYARKLNYGNFRVFQLENRPNSFTHNDNIEFDMKFDKKYPYKIIQNSTLSQSDIQKVKSYCIKNNIDFN